MTKINKHSLAGLALAYYKFICKNTSYQGFLEARKHDLMLRIPNPRSAGLLDLVVMTYSDEQTLFWDVQHIHTIQYYEEGDALQKGFEHSIRLIEDIKADLELSVAFWEGGNWIAARLLTPGFKLSLDQILEDPEVLVFAEIRHRWDSITIRNWSGTIDVSHPNQEEP